MSWAGSESLSSAKIYYNFERAKLSLAYSLPSYSQLVILVGLTVICRGESMS